ncbi:DNA-binding LacI/PurR family transcriptional regulator [Albidovulum inexpectatum]|uniref:DNA-binding LacI/PurR family transcriptional regulator n=1 Tax=Albidovulum inexpectatum TaxID=196587 RepID=A0A2S5JDC5_9RHOB|nr:LacI family DNA-binding transcriptional regulator [Albidovulum inexpectatum]PPB79487.1 DNA-binding LacI/PurR family transcriptional regulator [Albidovulum inexpectatum]
MAVTMKDVALRAGVSRSAVSRTFTKGASVSAKTRAKVEKAAAELGYSPNALASSLTTGRTKLIGLVSNNFHNPLFLEIFDLFTRGLQDRGLRPLLVNLSDETDPANSIRMLRQYSVDGVIVASSTLPPSFAEAFRSAGIPVVHSFGRYSTSPHVHVVGIDNVACGRMAAEALVARGYHRVAFMGGPESATSTQDRARGFLEAMREHPDIDVSISYAAAYSFDAGRAEMQRLLKAGPAQGYFCGDDVLSIGALSAIRDAGLNVPRDIGIIGFNDMEMAGWEYINLTTIRQPLPEIIDASIELVIATIEHPDRHPETRLFPCRVIERGTLPPLDRANTPRLAKPA